VPTLRSKDVDLDRAREEIAAHTQAVGSLISNDARSLSLLVYVRVPEALHTLDPTWSKLKAASRTDEDARAELERLRPEYDAASRELAKRRAEQVASIREIVARWQPRLSEPVRLSGTTVIFADVLDQLRHDLRVFGLAALILFALAFLAFYRRVRFVLLPMLTCALPVVLIVGAMSLLQMRLTVITANLPLILFTLMLPYTIYFVERYLERRALAPEEGAAEATMHAARAIWVPCLFSCATTMAGFAALMTSGTLPVHDFGLMMTAGMALGLLLVFLALPAMSHPLPPVTVRAWGVHVGPKKVVRLFAALALRRPAIVVGSAAVVLVVAVWGATRISAQAKITAYFKKDTPVYQGLEFIDRRMGGTTPLEVLIESPKPNFFVSADGLAALRAVQAYFDTVPETGSVQSIATLVDELKKKNAAVESLMPLLARHPLVRNVTRDYANDDYTIGRVLVRLRETAPTLDRARILRGLRAHMAQSKALEGLEVHETGLFLLYANMLDTLLRTQRETFGYVVAAIYLMLLLLFRSPVLALLVVLTQVLPAVVMLGLMGWAGITLDLVTVMIASIAMGVGIDASIQYTVRFRAELADGASPRDALRHSHATIGRAIWVATTVIIAGFCVLTLSDFQPSIYLGLLTAVAMFVSQVAALTILPSIFLLTGFPRPPASSSAP
jgi:predicted RND superfamily exporter protein